MHEIKFIEIPEWFYDEMPFSHKKKLYFYKLRKNKLDKDGNIIKEKEWLDVLNKINTQKE